MPVPEPELADAQNYLSGIFSMGLATQDGLLSQLATVALNDLPDDYLETYREKVRALTPADLLATARKYFDSANMQIVVVGDRAQDRRRKPNSSATSKSSTRRATSSEAHRVAYLYVWSSRWRALFYLVRALQSMLLIK